MATAIMSSMIVKPEGARRARADPNASRESVSEKGAGTAGARDASGRSRQILVKPNPVDLLRR
jgi:hypothetical protein